MVDKLVIYPDAIDRNLNMMRGLVFSQRILLALTQAGISREDAYVISQRNAMKVWNEGGTLLERMQADPDVTAKIKPKDLEALFDMSYHTKHVDTIFKRVFG